MTNEQCLIEPVPEHNATTLFDCNFHAFYVLLFSSVVVVAMFWQIAKVGRHGRKVINDKISNKWQMKR